MPADDARPVLPSRTIGPLVSDDPESEPPRRKGEGPGHRPTGQATLASHAARWPLLDGPRTGRRDDLVCAQPRHRGPLARFRPQVRRALLRTHPDPAARPRGDRKSTRLNSSHSQISYAVFCLKKKIIFQLSLASPFTPSL